MLSSALVIAAGLLWLGVLFGTALWAERRPDLLARQWPVVYSLSLAVYCTSWTFYGTVTQAQRSGWPIPPTFIGTILLYALGFGFLVKLLRLAREHNSTSLADLIATRLGKNSWLAAVVTLIAVIGIVPYIALQLKAVAMSYDLLTRAPNVPTAAWQDSALYVASAMALFAMLFGTRRVSAAEHNRGLVLAMAVESLLKLGAMLAVGAFVAFGLNVPDLPAVPVPDDGASGFPALILLGALAMFTLPHQFHMGVVECRDETQLRTARWLFPAYLLLIALPILPLARAGDALLAPLQVPSDLYVLALPLAQGQEGLALLAFLGGLSAATGMVILATLALSVMISNHWLAPLLLRRAWSSAAGQGDLRGAVLLQRRLGIIGVVLCAWLYSRAIAGSDALADIGALSFSGLATLAPAVWLAVYRPRTPPLAVLIGLLAALAVWSYVLLLPALADAFSVQAAWIAQGPFGWGWLSPDGLLGLGEWSRIGRATTLSLLTGFVVSALFAARLGVAPDRVATRLSPAVLREVAARFLPSQKIDALLAGEVAAVAVSAKAEGQVERELAAVLGAASARLLLNAAWREQGRDLDAVATIVGEASQVLRFNQRVLEAALENMSQGISVVDADLRLVAWNIRYAELFAYPPALLKVGVPVAELVAYNVAKGLGGSGAAQAEIDKRIRTMRAGTPYVTERRFGESVVEIRGNPMPGGGFVATFTDVTQFRRAEADLKSIAATLEQRVAERTAELAGAKAEAERANRAKTRFLAAVSHDLAQPLNAAHLFVHALAPQLTVPSDREALGHIDGALTSAELLLSGLLDISRLEAGGMAPKLQPFRLDTLLQPLVAEFGVLAAEKGLQLRAIATSVWVHSDAQLLRRVLQNFLSNAVRHTVGGRIVVGVRRRGAAVAIEVWDTGPGIAHTDHVLIFEEFRRLHPGGQGLGLGLAIAERIARLLQHPLALRSQLGHGSVFAIEVPRCSAVSALTPTAIEALPPAPRLTVLVVDNDADVLRGMQALLHSWQCTVLAARNAEEALCLVQACPPDLLLLDYHLDAGQTGLHLREYLRSAMPPRPCILISADHSAEVASAVAAAGCVLLHKPLKPLALKSAMARLTLGMTT